ncbi:DUF3237 domain-containing protein [Paenibacillus spiritus]|uniref:DUF3237 domain-containing protein n=1 Tax=Paenibacillus spiritus TaxID=2496557 RepID=A0A5J5GDJ7_9BACL|nr:MULTISPECIES: DUF3237 family protein [Paenibacillus]KAA9005862.1 DUF3237 domain-containing protein [Paenibacillus spiritus]
MEWEEVFTVQVKIGQTTELHSPDGSSVTMIAFSGSASGPYFEGVILDGGIDTQIMEKGSGRPRLSARYMLRGTDYTGQPCEIYVENNGEFGGGDSGALFRTCPKIITNSAALAGLNEDLLAGEGRESEPGVEIRIYRALPSFKPAGNSPGAS